MRVVFLLSVCQLFSSCAVMAVLCPSYPDSHAITKYEVKPDMVTPDGILVDSSGFQVHLDDIDWDTDEAEKCLKRPIRRCAFAVKIAPDWYRSECTGVQLFPCDTPETGCGPFTCTCACTGTVQNGSTIVTTPNLMSYRHELIHLVTGKGDNQHDEDCFRCSGE